MLNAILTLVILSAVSGVLMGAVYGMSYVLRMRSEGKPILPFAGRTAVPWGLVDLVMVFVLYVACTALSIPFARNFLQANLTGSFEDMSAHDKTAFLVSQALSSIAVFILSLMVVNRRSGATLRDIGVSPSQPWNDLLTGFLTFCVIIIPVFSVQAVLMQFFKPEHPIIKMLIKDATPGFFAASCFLAVIVAPIVEEFLFRVLFQGWMENLAAAHGGRSRLNEKQVTSVFMGGWRFNDPRPQPLMAAAESVTPQATVTPMPAAGQDLGAVEPNATALNSFSASSEEQAAELQEPISVAELPIAPVWWPIVLSSIAFAAAHFGHGTDPIPLFLVALGLGWLYQRTHRLWPCIVVHMTLNGLSMLQLGYLIFVGDPTQIPQ